MLGPILSNREWQMTPGERSALEGVLAVAAPKLSIEIGTAQGGSLARVSAHSEEVHSFDLAHAADREWPANAVLHSGDSHKLLPKFLNELTEAGRNVDFVLVDGDHTSDGVRQDMCDLLASPAIGRTVILAHDTLNGEVREGIEAAKIRDRSEVTLYDLDFVAGHLSHSGPFAGQLWGGLGMVLVDRSATGAEEAPDDEFEDAFRVFSAFANGGGSGGAPKRRGFLRR